MRRLAGEADDQLPDVDELASLVSTLSSPVRLELLRKLRAPKLASDLRVRAERKREGLRSDRLLSRPAISQHLADLEDEALVERTDEDQYVVNHQRLFSALHELSRLATIQPEVEVDVEETLKTRWTRTPGGVSGPRLVLVGGPREGQLFPLRGEGPWWLGRGSKVDIRLDYDPHVSREHAKIVEESDGTFAVVPQAEATNPTLVDFEPVEEGKRSLVAGSVLAVGSSRLVLKIA